ncbi:MAG: alpha/beta hydrolase [Acidimicrobiales bacterium]
MPETPVYFGDPACALFGWLGVPGDAAATSVTGAAVLCPPLGIEALAAHYTYRRMARRLHASGMATLRFDYAGTGDSAGDATSAGTVRRWVDSVHQAVALLENRGAPRVALIGMRAGALLAAVAAADEQGLDALVMWDPCPHGRGFLRELQALGAFGMGPPEPMPRPPAAGSTEARHTAGGGVRTPGFDFAAPVAAELAALSIAGTQGALAKRVLVALRPNRPLGPELARRMQMSHVQWTDAAGQEDLIGSWPPEPTASVPTMEHLVGWTSAVVTGERAAFDTAATTTAAEVGRDAAMRPVLETPVRLGPLGLFGILTDTGPPDGDRPGDAAADDGEPGGRPTIVLLNNGILHHVGPGRLWVDLARQWAAEGLKVLRVDLSGIGDSPVRPGQPERAELAPEALQDMQDIARAQSPDDPANVVLVGSCSGGYHAIEAGLALGARGACAINPVFSFSRPEAARPNAPGTSRPGPRRQAYEAGKGWVTALASATWMRQVNRHLPDAVFRVGYGLGLRQAPVASLEAMVHRGSELLVLSDEPDARRLGRGSRRRLRALSGSGHFELKVIPGLDHALFREGPRREAAQAVTGFLLATTRPRSRRVP